jgi:antitoxin CptB
MKDQNLAERQRRMLYRAWHRGMREMDLLMGGFAEARLAGMSEPELDQFESLINLPDHDLYRWIAGAEPVPLEHDHDIFRALASFEVHKAPFNV